MTLRQRARRLVTAATLGAAAAVGLSAFDLPALAQTDQPMVTLKSFDGFTQLRGKLVKFDGSTFTIETVLGTIQVDALQVNCEGDGCPQNLMFGAEFGIHGSNAIGASLMPALIQGYADMLDADLVSEVGAGGGDATLRIVHADGREMAAINLQGRGSSSSYRSLAAATADIGMSSRQARDRDVAVLNSAGLPDPRDTENEHVIGVDGLIVVVHPSNPIQSMSLEEIALIFSGVVSNWSQLGGPDLPINIYAPNDDSGTFQTFGSLVLGPLGSPISPLAGRLDSNIQVSDAVAGDKSAVGITAAAFERAAKSLPLRQECGILSYPTSFAMKTEEYPLSRRLYLYTPRKDMTAHARQLIEFAKSPEAQPLIADAGFVNQSIEFATINNQGDRVVYALTGEDEVSVPLLREFLTEVRAAARLSTTFRFTPGSSRLEPKSQRDAELFADDLASGVYDGREVMLIGFTDSVGQFELNRGLSARRAQVVADTLVAAVPEGALENAQITVRGYGELAPVGCNTTLGGRSANRRVEVWVRDPA